MLIKDFIHRRFATYAFGFKADDNLEPETIYHSEKRKLVSESKSRRDSAPQQPEDLQKADFQSMIIGFLFLEPDLSAINRS